MVRQTDRKPSKFITLDAALEVATYTQNILDNEKIFNPIHKTTIDRIGSEATMIYHYCRVANSLDARDSVSLKKRIELQEEALLQCEFLKTDIMLAKGLFHLRTQRIRHWNGLVNTAMELIKKWTKSDKDKLKTLQI